MHVMIAVDDSHASVGTIDTARRLLGSDAHYTVASIGEPSAHLMAYDPIGLTAFDIRTLDVTDAADAVAVATEAARRAGLDEAEITADVGAPGPQLCALAERLAADVVVIGCHDRGWLSRMFQPSTHAHLLKHSPCPVLIDRG